jgi:heat-inducible transcriptional repressor
MEDLSERQIKILKAIIEEFIETATPVGSDTLERKHNLRVSPATIRNEMVKLDNLGFLKQAHTSSGRTPTPMALKFYVNNLMKQEGLSLAEEVAVKEKVWDYRSKFDKLLRESTKELAHRTKMLSLATTDEGDLYSSGMGNILEAPEFFDIDLAKTILSYLDQFDYWQSLIDKALGEEDPIHILLGRELGMEIFEPCGFIYTGYKAGPRSGAIGVVGPSRVRYSKVIPMVKYFGDLISEISQRW